jgi:hypothetical protein
LIEIYSGATLIQSIYKVISSNLRETLEGEFTLSFNVMARSALALKTKQTAKLGNQYFEIVQVGKSIQGSLPTCSVLCEHVSYLLNNEIFNITEFDFTGNPATGLSQLLEGTPFSAGIVEFTENITLKINQKVSRRAALMQYIAIIGGEIEYDGYNINIRSHRGSLDYILVMDSKNVTNVSVFHDSRENTSSYDISFFKLMDLAVGDNVHIVFNPLGISVKTRIISLEYNPFYRYNIKVEVGSYKPSISDTFYRIEKTIHTVDYAFEDSKLNSATLKGLRIVNEEEDKTTFEITEDGYVIISTDNAIIIDNEGFKVFDKEINEIIRIGEYEVNKFGMRIKSPEGLSSVELGKYDENRYGLKIVGENNQLMLDEYGIDPRFIKAFNNMVWNSSFERFDSTTKIPQYWSGGEATASSSFDNTHSMKINVGQMSEQTQSIGNYTPRPDPAWWDNKRTRVSFFKKGGDVQVQVFSEFDFSPFALTDEDGTTQTFYNTGPSSNWEDGRYTFSFEPTKSGRVWIRFSNIGGGAAYIDAVQMEPDFNGKYPSFYTNGAYSVSADEVPLSDTWLEYINVPYDEIISIQFNQRYTLPPTVTASLLRNINASNNGSAFGNHNISPNIDLIIEEQEEYLFYTGALITFGGSAPSSISNGYISIQVVGRV